MDIQYLELNTTMKGIEMEKQVEKTPAKIWSKNIYLTVQGPGKEKLIFSLKLLDLSDPNSLRLWHRAE